MEPGIRAVKQRLQGIKSYPRANLGMYLETSSRIVGLWGYMITGNTSNAFLLFNVTLWFLKNFFVCFKIKIKSKKGFNLHQTSCCFICTIFSLAKQI